MFLELKKVSSLLPFPLFTLPPLPIAREWSEVGAPWFFSICLQFWQNLVRAVVSTGSTLRSLFVVACQIGGLDYVLAFDVTVNEVYKTGQYFFLYQLIRVLMGRYL